MPLLGLIRHDASSVMGAKSLTDCSACSAAAGFSRRARVAVNPSLFALAVSKTPASSRGVFCKHHGSRANEIDAWRLSRQFLNYCRCCCSHAVVADKIRVIESAARTFVRDGRWSRAAIAAAAASFMALGGGGLLQEDAACAEALAGFVPVAFPWESTTKQEQVQPSKGTCATCIGVVDETLGACNAAANCVSSFDDRPRFFVAPWEFPGQLPFAVEKLRDTLVSSSATIEEQEERYVHAVFTSKDGVMDDVEFLFSNPREDAIVVIRSASRAVNMDDQERNRKRLEEIRKTLTWEQVPVLRNRKRALFFLESPWDTFGPEPPPSFDYKDLDLVPE